VAHLKRVLLANETHNKGEQIVRKSTFLFVVGIVAALTHISGEFVVAQNANSSTATTSSSNTAAKKPRSRKPKAKAAAATSEAGTTETAEPQQMTPKPKKRTGRCDPNQQEQTDLSGTYQGRVKHGDQVMDGTLTITGNDFTMTSGSDTHSGKIVAVTTCGYTAVAVSMPGEGGQMSIHSLRARKVGNSLTLTSVPGEPEKMSFTTGGGAGKPRRHRAMKPKTATPAATPTTPPQ
jgi:hypothetical protein